MIDFILTLIKEALQGAYVQYQQRLTDEEREILIECAHDGALLVLQVAGFGSWLRASKRDFFVQSDPAVQARYLESFQSLCRRGYVRHESGFLFCLTGTGFEKAREIALEKSIVVNNSRALPQ